MAWIRRKIGAPDPDLAASTVDARRVNLLEQHLAHLERRIAVIRHAPARRAR